MHSLGIKLPVVFILHSLSLILSPTNFKISVFMISLQFLVGMRETNAVDDVSRPLYLKSQG